MKTSFLEKMNTASKVKIKSEGTTVQIPRSALREARDLAIKLVCFEYHCSEKDILKNPSKYDSKLEAAFRGYLEGYAESVIPAKNPGGRHRADQAIKASQLNDIDGFWKRAFPQENEKERETRQLIFKSAIMKISDTFLEANMKIPPRTLGEGKGLPSSKIGLNRTLNMGTKETRQVVYNQYAQLASVTITLALLEKLFALGKENIEGYLDQTIGPKTIEELEKKDREGVFVARQKFVADLKNKLDLVLSSVDLRNSLR
jgi:hypothetical protein